MRNKAAKFLQRVTSTTREYRRAKRFWNRIPHSEKPGFKQALQLAALRRESEPLVWLDEADEISIETWKDLSGNKNDLISDKSL
jgi:hypothetical protein